MRKSIYSLVLLGASTACAFGAAKDLLDAALRGDGERIGALLREGADPNAPGSDGTTPLMNAARSGDLASVRILLEAGARVRVWGPGGHSAWDLAPAANTRLREELSRRRAREIRDFPAVLPPAGISLQAMLRLVAAPSLTSAPARRRIVGALQFLRNRWQRMRGRQAVAGPPVAGNGFARSLARDLYALDLALYTNDAALLDAIAADLETKASDCAARPEGLGGDVKVTLKTIAPRGEVSGWKLAYIERFLWDLRDKISSFSQQWHECSRLSAAIDEPIPAGNYALVAISPEARSSQPKMIEVAVTRPAVFEIVVP
ncbi:MAG TPA: ankyrin repeat domain-containing protein [Bryobacteraceae bacterium]